MLYHRSSTSIFFFTLIIITLVRLLSNKKGKAGVKGYASLSVSKRWALSLSHPMGEQVAEGGLDFEDPTDYSDEILQNLSKSLKIHLGLRQQETPNINDFTVQAKNNWYKWVVEKLHPDDNWKDGIAFACGRTAFILRAAYLVGWLDKDTHWQLLMLNARRAQGCFKEWEEFAIAWSQGRTAWIKRSQIDTHGWSFSPEEVTKWLADKDHPWYNLPWQTNLLVEHEVISKT